MALEPRIGRLLELFLNHPGELLTHDRLIEAAWGGRVVSNEAVRHAVFTLRQALATGGDAGFIRTIHKKGYIAEFPHHVVEDSGPGMPIAAPVPDTDYQRSDSASESEKPARTDGIPIARFRQQPWVLGLLIVITLAAGLWSRIDPPRYQKPGTMDAEAPVKEPATIAVLPFTNLSQAADSDILADGLAEELQGTLSLNPELRVTARPSAFQFSGPDRNVRDVGERLGVRYVLDGSVRKLGGRVRIHTRLVDAETGGQLWSDEYDRSLEDWFDLQQVVATEVTRALEGVLHKRYKPIPQGVGTANVDAHLEVLRARQLLASRAVADAEQAIEHLQRALLLDPNYALAYARLADAILIQAESTNGMKAVRPVVAPLLDKALTLDPGLGEAYCLRSLLTDDKAAAERDLRRGLELNPSYARGYELLGRMQNSVDSIDSAIALDPLTPGNYHAKAMLMMIQGNWEEAAELDRRALELNPNYRAALTQLSQDYAVQGHFADAIEYARRAVALDPRAIPMRDHLILMYLAVGDLEAARATNKPPTPFGTWAIVWAEGKEWQLVDKLYQDNPSLLKTIDPMVSSQLLLRQAESDGDYNRALTLLSRLLPIEGALPPEARGWGLYAYANLAQLLLLSGDQVAASRLQEQIEERMTALAKLIPRHALINSQVRAVLLARAGRSEDACEALEQAYVPNPRPYWRVILANPAFDSMSTTSCFRALQTRINEYITAERARIDTMDRPEQNSESAPSSPDHGTGEAT